MKKQITNDEPDNNCFGCSPHNAQGLRLEFLEREPGLIESRYTAGDWLCGPDGVIHGGIQAALLDEVMGMAAHSASGHEELFLVTADFSLHYRRPAPIGVSLTIRGRFVRHEGRDFHVEGEILNGDGEVLTRAEARWCSV